VHAIERQRVVVGLGAEQLREPRESGTALPPEIEPIATPSQPHHIVRRQRPWTHCAHLAAEDVDELRHLVEAGRAEEASDARDATVAHRSELQDVESATFVPDALLTKEYRRPIVDERRQSNERHHGRKDGEPGGGADHVEYPMCPRHAGYHSTSQSSLAWLFRRSTPELHV